MTAYVPFVWQALMALSAAVSVGSHAQSYQMKEPTISWTCLIWAGESGADVSEGTGFWTLMPYFIGAERYGEC